MRAKEVQMRKSVQVLSVLSRQVCLSRRGTPRRRAMTGKAICAPREQAGCGRKSATFDINWVQSLWVTSTSLVCQIVCS